MVNERNRNTFEWKLYYMTASRHVEFFGVGVLSRFVKRFKDHYFQVDVKFGAKRCIVALIVHRSISPLHVNTLCAGERLCSEVKAVSS